MTTGTLKIHSENILPIIKKWLYSEKDIFVRELVSNACDAIRKLKILRDQGITQVLDEEFRIEIHANEEEGTLKFIDTGIGMDAEEVQKYIAELAFSGAEDFVQKYSSNEEKDQIIGHFGLGFYSAYMVAKKVQIDTLSYKDSSQAVLWTCDGGAEYEITDSQRAQRGTEITLFVSEEEKEFLKIPVLSEILRRYCSFLPFPIYLNETHINKHEPLWIKAPVDCEEKDYLDFYQKLYPMEPAPLFWIHLNVDYPFHLKGVLYFPKIDRHFDFKKSSTRLFCNRVFVSENCQDLLPDYLTMLRGAIDSPDIPLNVSRSYLQMDQTVRQLGSHISKKVSDRLGQLYKEEKERFIDCWKDIEVIIKLGAIQNDKFYARVKDFLLWKNGQGQHLTVEEYLEKNRQKHENKVYYATEGASKDVLALYHEKELEVLITTSAVDLHFLSFLEGKLSSVKFQRIDSSLEDDLIDSSKEKSLLDADGKTEASRLAEFAQKHLEIEGLKIEAKSLAKDSISSFVLFNEQSRRMRDFMASTQSFDFPDQGEKTLVLNTNNSLVKSLEFFAQKDLDFSKKILTHLYEQALLSQKELPPEALSGFLERNNELLEGLSQKALDESS